jgi:hypothetical protein
MRVGALRDELVAKNVENKSYKEKGSDGMTLLGKFVKGCQELDLPESFAPAKYFIDSWTNAEQYGKRKREKQKQKEKETVTETATETEEQKVRVTHI